MEVYRNTIGKSHLELPEVPDEAPTAETTLDGEVVALTVSSPSGDGPVQWEANFPHTQNPGSYRIRWKWGHDDRDYTLDELVDVVVPLVTAADAREQLDIPASISDDQIRRTERKVRRLIERITGQVFAPIEATLTATQLTDGSVRLPQRLLALTSVGGVANSLYYAIGEHGWKLVILYPVKRTGIRAGEVPIADPFASFRAPKIHKVIVHGRWGWESVPSDIYEAALILIEQQLCPDAVYAERYLKTMTAADFRFEFDPGAYRGTGNVIADRLLSKYVATGAAVI